MRRSSPLLTSSRRVWARSYSARAFSLSIFEPNSASSQFYFALSDINFLDGDYAVFGYVTEGMEVVDTIKQGDKIDSAKVISGAENLKK